MSVKRNYPPNYKQYLLQALKDLRHDSTLSITKVTAYRVVSLITLIDRKNKRA
jgi:hypothetical protein